jgi:hypothetical protein
MEFFCTAHDFLMPQGLPLACKQRANSELTRGPRGDTMRKQTICGISLVAVAGMLALVPAAGAQSAKAASNQVTITGTVTCSKFVNSRPDRKGFSAAEAIRLCVRQGYDYVLISGKNAYTLQGAKDELAKLAGSKATVAGRVNTDLPTGAVVAVKDTVDVAEVAPAAN